MAALFISETYLKTFAPINNLVDVATLFPFVKSAQDKYIIRYLGKDLYVRLQQGVTDADLNSDEVELLALLQPALAWYALFDALPFINYQVRNKGVLSQGGDNTTNAGLTELKFLREEASSNAEYYLQQVVFYLCDNSKKFPEYCSDNLPYPTLRTPYKGGFFTEKQQDIDVDYLRKWLKG
jgi:hypothetical protein